MDRRTIMYAIEVAGLVITGVTELIVTKELSYSITIFFFYGIFKIIKFIAERHGE